ncbi:hypothetical protein ACFL42_01370 [Candidatus Omnitrophota bacterium]
MFKKTFIVLMILLSASAAPFAETIHQTGSGRLYVNEEFGFSFACPENWNCHMDPPIRGTLVLFNKSDSIEKVLPCIALLIDDIRARFKSSGGFAQAIIADYTNRGNIVLEPISKIVIGDLEGLKFSTEYSIEDAGLAFRVSQYVFEKEDFVISLMFGATKQDYEKYRKDFKKSLITFAFLKPEDDFMTLTRLSDSKVPFRPVIAARHKSFKKKVLDAMKKMRSFKAMFALKDKTDERFKDRGYLRWEWSMIYNAPDDFEIYQLNYFNGLGDIWRVAGDDIYCKIGEWMPMPMQGDADDMQGYIKARKTIYKALTFDRYCDILENEEPLAIGWSPDKRYAVLQYHIKGADELFTGEKMDGTFRTEVFLWISEEDDTIRFAKTVVTGAGTDGREISEEYDHYFSSYNAPFVLGDPGAPKEGSAQ